VVVLRPPVEFALDAVVAVVDQASRRFALLHSHAQGVEDQFAAKVIGHRPPNDPAGAGVEDDGEVEEAFPGA
jgi:hypothetical protein